VGQRVPWVADLERDKGRISAAPRDLTPSRCADKFNGAGTIERPGFYLTPPESKHFVDLSAQKIVHSRLTDTQPLRCLRLGKALRYIANFGHELRAQKIPGFRLGRIPRRYESESL